VAESWYLVIMGRKNQDAKPFSYTKQIGKEKREEVFWKRFFQVPDLSAIPYHANWVKLSFTTVQDEDLEFLTKRIRSIEMLDLKDTAITHVGIKHLLALEYLGELRLKESVNIDDLCLRYIGQIQSLNLLQVNYTAITPDGLQHLKALYNLKTLFLSFDIEETNVRRALDDLKKALPGCEVVVRGKTYTAN